VGLKWGTELSAAQTLVQSQAGFAMAAVPKSRGVLPPFVLQYDPSNALVAGDDPSGWADLRMTGTALDALGAGLFTTAVSVLNWHDAAQFCARDGSPTRVANAGWHRHCEANGHEEYPRTDPAVICLVHDGGDRILLARQPSWPEGRFTVLAGFVEGGESLEACVEREIHEEVGVHVTDIRYLGSQAWPFPRSLMVAFHAVADRDIAERYWGRRHRRAYAYRSMQEMGIPLAEITTIIQLNDEEFAAKIADHAVSFTAPKGTLIFCNTCGFHRGGFATGKPRVLATVTWSSPASLASLTERNFTIRADGSNGLRPNQEFALS